MNRLDLCPLQSSYSAEFGDGVLSQDLAKGMPRTRADFIGAVHMVDASFTLSPDDYNYIMAFYRVYQRNPQPFLVGLYLDEPTIKDYICKFVGALSFSSKNGRYVSVSCQLVVKPLTTDIEFDESIVALRNGGTTFDTLNLLEELVNEDLPNALGEI